MYEISFIFKTEDASSLQKILSRHGAEVHEGVELKKVRLAYPIKKNEYGFLGSFRFEMKPEDLGEIFRDLKLEGDLLRYMVTKPEEKKSGVRGRGEGRVAQTVSVSKKAEEPKRHSEPVLTNEELEKKIEEILQ